MNSGRLLSEIVIVYVATLLFFGIGAVTTPQLGWYRALTLPAWAPPELLVAAVWCLLFILTAISLSTFWEKAPRDTSFLPVVTLYTGNAGLVLLWDYAFFGAHNIQAAFWVSLLVGCSVLAVIVCTWKISRLAAALLVPYFLWTVFAAYLLYSLMLLNS